MRIYRIKSIVNAIRVFHQQNDTKNASAVDHALKKKFTRDDFKYDSKFDRFTCPAGRTLRRTTGSTYQNEKDTRRYITKQSDCQPCSMREQCFKSRNAKRRNITVRYNNLKPTYSAQMITKMDSRAGRKVYSRRMGIVEPVFGNLSHNKNLNRFMLRTRVKVDTQWQLYAIVHNIEKIANYGKLSKL